MSVKPFLNNSSALNKKGLDLFCDEFTSNSVRTKNIITTTINNIDYKLFLENKDLKDDIQILNNRLIEKDIEIQKINDELTKIKERLKFLLDD